MRSSRIDSIYAVSAIAVICARVGAAGFDPSNFLTYDIKGVVLQPQFDVGVTATDNLFFGRNEGRVSDVITTFSPGLRLQVGRDTANQASLEYMHDEVVVMDHSDFGRGQDRLDFNVRFKKDKFTLDGSDRVQFLSSILGGGSAIYRQLVNRRAWTDNYRLTYDWTSKTDLYLQGLHDDLNYDSNLNTSYLLNQTTYQGLVGSSYELTAKYRLTTEAYFGYSQPRSINTHQLTSDSQYYGGSVGLKGSFTSKLTGTAKIGYEQRDFVSGPSAASATPAISLTLNYQQDAKRTFSLNYDRRTGISQNFMSQLQVLDTVTFSVIQGLGEGNRWAVRGTANFSNRDMARERLSGQPSLISLARTDVAYGLGLGLFYKPQNWMTWSLSYSFDSYSISTEDPRLLQIFPYPSYHVNSVSLSASIGF